MTFVRLYSGAPITGLVGLRTETLYRYDMNRCEWGYCFVDHRLNASVDNLSWSSWCQRTRRSNWVWFRQLISHSAGAGFYNSYLSVAAKVSSLYATAGTA